MNGLRAGYQAFSILDAKIVSRTNSHPRRPGSFQIVCLFSLETCSFLKTLFIFRQRGKEGEREGNINMWLASVCPLLGTWQCDQACALTGN